MEQWWVKLKLKCSVESTGKDAAVTLCTAEPPWLSLHDYFAKICNSIRGKKFVFRAICNSLCDHDVELDRMPLASHSERFGKVPGWMALQTAA